MAQNQLSSEGLGNMIAIVGMGCRYPGAQNHQELWQLLVDGKDSVGNYPGERFPGVDEVFALAARTAGRGSVARGGYLQNIDQFDAGAFELSPREAMYLDPQHRLLLEVAREALEEGGQLRTGLRGSRTGVFVGQWTSDFESRMYATGSALDFYVLTGNGRSGASGRLSFAFDFQGPSLTVDTACSSSLVAVHLACESLLSGESDMALAGGTNVILATEATEMFTQAKMLSPDGRCKFGDASADGFVRSEGAGIVVLKRLQDALAAGDPIHAVIRGSAVNNDGTTSGTLMTPSREGQRLLLHKAWAAAGVRGGDLRYIEAHGTGTSVGDPIEISAIGTALKDAHVTETCWVGSIKSNIGHTESAAGVAGLIKVALAVKHRFFPRSLHLAEPTPKVDWESIPARVLTEPLDMSGEAGVMLAGVSSFGLTGTNAHVVVEEFCEERQALAGDELAHLLAVSARTPEALRALLQAHLVDAEQRPGTDSLRDVCYTAGARREHYEYRAAIVAGDSAELKLKLKAALEDELAPGVVQGRKKEGHRRVVFIAPGQGSQWTGMARELAVQEPAFRGAFDRCDEAILKEAGWSLKEVLLGGSTDDYLQQIDVIQPALFAMSYSLAALWRSWGVEPDAVIGHSMGEVSAAAITGALSLADAVAVICRRSRLMKTIRGSGAMATVELSAEKLEIFLGKTGGKVQVGATNSPFATVISGDATVIDELLERFEEQEIFCRRIKVDVASHSSQVEPILRELRDVLGHLQPQSSSIPLYSTVQGRYLPGEELGADYWVQNLRKPVLYSKGIHALANDGHDIFIELSPHPILMPATEACLRGLHGDAPNALVVSSMRRETPERAAMLTSLGALYAFGFDVAWELLYPAGGQCLRLPTYPFQREHCWPDVAALEVEGRTQQGNASGMHALLGRRFESSLAADTIVWEARVGLKSAPYLKDHRVLQSVVLPASAHIELALEAMRAEHPESKYDLTAIALGEALYLSGELPSNQVQEIQLGLRRQANESYSFEIRSRIRGLDDAWILSSSGRLEPHGKIDSPQTIDIESLKAQFAGHADKEEHYEALSKSGLIYGPAFQGFEEAWIGEGECLCRVRAGAQESGDLGVYVLHPTVLDSCFQTMTHVRPATQGFLKDDTVVPTTFDGIQIFAAMPLEGEIFVHARLTYAEAAEAAFALDLRVFNAEGQVLAEVEGMRLQRVSGDMEHRVGELLQEISWVKLPELNLPEQAGANLASAAGKLLLVFADRAGVGERLALEVEALGGQAILIRNGAKFTRLSGAGLSLGIARREYEVSLAAEDLLVLFRELAAGSAAPTDVVHLWSLDGAEPFAEMEVLLQAQESGSYHISGVVQAISASAWTHPPRLWMVTAGAIAVEENAAPAALAGAPMWGIGAVIAVEHPELHASLVDMSTDADAVETESLVQRILRGEAEDRIALRGSAAYAFRFVRAKSDGQVDRNAAKPLQADEEFHFEITSPGILDNLALRAQKRTEPGAGEVSIEAVAVGLNFIDITKAMGICPGLDPKLPVRMGVECAGRVIAVGEGVGGFQTGDCVVAISKAPLSVGLLTSQICLPVGMVVHAPEKMTLEEAAGLPIAYLTAYYSLVELARMRKGEWILIPAGAGGVGLAAIQIARELGVRVIATASSEEKRAYLRSLGVEHALPSRTLAFADEVMRITEGLGVDVVLNSLAGEYIPRSLEVLRPYGRFIELGKRDIYEDRPVGLKVFRKNLSYFAVDLAAAVEERPEYLSELLQTVMGKIGAGIWAALPVQVFDASDAAAPFHFMAQGKHTGKVVIAIHRDVRVLPRKETLFRKDATYLITGGMGGVGSTVAEWMAANGAGNLVLVSRRAASAETAEITARIEAAGARVIHARTDILSAVSLGELVEFVRETMPPLRGIMHAAAVIDDALVMDLDAERFPTVMGPKVQGTWNLYQATKTDELDFMVLFSSIAAVVPQPGHGSYAAANAWMDAFARYARAAGKPVRSVNWGGWDQTGLAREAGTGRSITGYRAQGFPNMSRPQALAALKRVLETDAVQVMATVFDPERFSKFHALSGIPPMYRAMVGDRSGDKGKKSERSAILESLEGTKSRDEAIEALRAYLIEELGRVLRLAPERIGYEKLFGGLGLDSLMALEFVRRLNSGLGIAIPTTLVFNYPTANALTEHLAQRLGIHTEELQTSAVPSMAAVASSLDFEEISEEEALRALMYPAGE